jgi:hypothetical protein
MRVMKPECTRAVYKKLKKEYFAKKRAPLG